MMTAPITPSEALKTKATRIPDKVIEAFNEVIIENIDQSGEAWFDQDVVIKRIMDKIPFLSRATIFEEKYLDVEPIFEEAGWEVKYVKGPYWDTTRRFEFTAPPPREYRSDL